MTVTENIIFYIAAAIALIFSIVLHELGHGYVALWNGDRTAKVNGRLSLNPLKHLDPIGFLMLVVFHFGYAKPVPVDPRNFRNPKLGMTLVSLAGVTVNLILSFFFTMFLTIVKVYAVINNYLLLFVYYLFYAGAFYNITLMLFNLLPLYPLDGFRLVESFTKPMNRVTRFLRNYSLFILLALIGMGVVVDIIRNITGAYGVSWLEWLDPLSTSLRYLSNFIFGGFEKFWLLIFG